MSRRERFLSEILENIRLPYEIEREGYAEEVIGSEFRNQVEERYFQQVFDNTEPQAVVLDLACGDGRHTLRCAEKVGEVVGIDLSRTSLVLAKKKCLAKDNTVFTEGSILQLPFRPNTFDDIWFSEAFEYVPPDKRESFLTSLNNVLKDSGMLYMSVETWQSSSIITSLKLLWADFKLFCYWKFIKRKPLLWGEFLHYVSAESIGFSGWHYHTHISKKTLCHLLDDCGFNIEKMNLYDEYIYVLCSKVSG